MPYDKYLLVVEGEETTASTSPKYSEVCNVQDYEEIGLYVKEDNTNAIKFTVEARGAVHSKDSEWTEILDEQPIAQNGHLFIGQTAKELSNYKECELLNENWAEIRIKYYDSVNGSHGKVYAWINRRTD